MNPSPSDFAPPDPQVLRLLDANANRAREALRVLEDYSRLILNDAPTSLSLKQLRHSLATAMKPVLPAAVWCRDAAGDVGAANKVDTEATRSGLTDVVVAAGKRLGEALRTLEEYTKTIEPAAAPAIERLRYLAYDIERDLVRTLDRGRRFHSVRLYVLISQSICRQNWLQAAEQALMGGADCLQLREKELDAGELLIRARSLVTLCRRYGALCIVNDRPDIAVLSDADGVHVGQGDLPAREVRKIVGERRIVGVSTHRLDQARQAVLDGADYLGVGPFFRSTTKPRDFIAGPDYAREIVEHVRLPAVAIAGITPENVGQVLGTGLRAIAVSSAVLSTDDVAGATRLLKARLTAGV